MKETNEKPKLVNCFYDGSISGFGDFLRGSIHLYSRCKSHNLDFDIDIKNHPINEFISSKYKDSVKKEEIKCIPSEVLKESNIHYHKRVNDFLFKKLSNALGVCHIFSNFDYVLNVSQQHLIKVINLLPPLGEECRKWFQENLVFSDEVKSFANKELENLGIKANEFEIIHFRLGDEVAFREGIKPKFWVPEDELSFKICQKITEERESNLPILFFSDCNELKKYVSEKSSELGLPIHVVHLKSSHMQKQTDANKKYLSDIDFSRENLFLTAVDIRLISLAKNARSFSVYPWGSGFITWVCKIYGIPFQLNRLKQK